MPRESTHTSIPVACFAPPLSDDALARYRALIDGLPADQAELQDALQTLLACVSKWWELPESQRTDGSRWKLYHVDRGAHITVTETPLEAAHVAELWDVTPWMRELDLLSTPRADGLFDGLTGELRDLAFHLLWHAKEITLDREPMTRDKVPA